MTIIKWEEQWVEVFSLLFLVIGLSIAVLLQNQFFSVITGFFSGFVAARIFYFKRYKEPIMPFILMIIGFLAGYLIGSFWVSRILILFFFAGGFAISYYLHCKEILVIFKSQRFIK